MQLVRAYRFTLTALLALVCIAGATQGQPEVQSRAVANLDGRLLALHPSRPEAYMELGEEVLNEMQSIKGQRLARTLLVLAFELDPTQHGPSALRASACLALASIAADQAEASWLQLMATTNSPAPLQLEPAIALAGRTKIVTDAARDLALLIAALRKEDASHMTALLEREDIQAILPGVKAALGPNSNLLARAKSRPVCPKCGSRRTVRARDRTEAQFELCPVCGGNPGARLSGEAFLATLRVEGQLIQADPQSWSGQILLDGAAPMRDTEGASLGAFYGVDPAKPYWTQSKGGRNQFGSWAERPEAQRSARMPSDQSDALALGGDVNSLCLRRTSSMMSRTCVLLAMSQLAQ